MAYHLIPEFERVPKQHGNTTSKMLLSVTLRSIALTSLVQVTKVAHDKNSLVVYTY